MLVGLRAIKEVKSAGVNAIDRQNNGSDATSRRVRVFTKHAWGPLAIPPTRKVLCVNSASRSASNSSGTKANSGKMIPSIRPSIESFVV
jgi:hypothetical protein